MQDGAKHFTQDMVLSLFEKAAKQQDALFNDIDLIVDSEPELLAGGVLNQVYKVWINDTEYVVKWMTGQQLDPTACGSNQELYDLQKHIAGYSELVPKPYAFIPNFNGYDAVIMEYIEGLKIGDVAGNNRDTGYAYLLGESIASFHDQTHSVPKFEVQPNDFKSVASELTHCAKRLWQKGQVWNEVQYLYTFFKYAVGTLFYPSDSGLPGGLIHGDLHQHNIFVYEDNNSVESVKLLDFDLVREDKYIKDIANAICMFCLPEITDQYDIKKEYIFDSDFAQHLIKGYESIRELSQAELDYLPTAIRDRIDLEKVGNMKLRNESKPPGTNFNPARAKVMEIFLKDEWVGFRESFKVPFGNGEPELVEGLLKHDSKGFQIRAGAMPVGDNGLAADVSSSSLKCRVKL